MNSHGRRAEGQQSKAKQEDQGKANEDIRDFSRWPPGYLQLHKSNTTATQLQLNCNCAFPLVSSHSHSRTRSFVFASATIDTTHPKVA